MGGCAGGLSDQGRREGGRWRSKRNRELIVVELSLLHLLLVLLVLVLVLLVLLVVLQLVLEVLVLLLTVADGVGTVLAFPHDSDFCCCCCWW